MDGRREKGKKKIALGYDTRFMSSDFARIVARVLAANDIDVLFSDAPIPTPALSYGVLLKSCVAGVMITASHNPYQFNGFKIKTAEGGGAGKDITDRVEQYLYKTKVKSVEFNVAVKKKKIAKYNYKTEYIKFMRSYIDLKKIKNSRFKVQHNCKPK